MVKRIVIALVVLVVVGGVVGAVRARGANDRAEADARPLFVPVVVTPSIQPVTGQVVLFKATNVSENPVSFRLMLFNDREAVPESYKDFKNVPAGGSVTYVHEPKPTQLTLGSTTVTAPEPVRATFAPVPGGETPNAIRRIIANVQLMRIQPPTGDAAATLEASTIVPLSHCNFEPRGFVPYTGGRWYWNCAPQMEPIDEKWRAGSQTDRRPY